MSEVLWVNEFDCENKIRELLCENVLPLCCESQIDIHILVNKGVADIIIYKNGDYPKLFFLEVKHWMAWQS